MSSAKDIVLRPISAGQASNLVKRVHYSGKVVQNSSLHIGVFYSGRLEGAMQFGSPIDRRKVLPLVRGTLWNQMLELNRMAFSEALPRNSESRAISVAFRLLRKHRPDIKWVLSFADGTQCGDGTIYRASGFVLTGIKRNSTIGISENLGTVVAAHGTSRAKHGKVTLLPGHQFRYIKFIDPSWRPRLTVPVIPFDKIPDDARMYRGEKVQP